MKRPLLIIFLILLIDQAVKFWVKTHMYLGQEFRFADWAIVHFTENNGMAFGMEFGGAYGKLALSIFRIFFVAGIFWYLTQLVKEKANSFYITCIAMVIAGAAGNIIDSTFYGVWFSGSDFQLASFLPANGGYSSLLHGKVVDMFYFPVLQGQYPEWFPLWGGDEFLFFRPVFNVADASISMGVILMIVFQKRVFGQIHDHKEEEVIASESSPSEENPKA